MAIGARSAFAIGSHAHELTRSCLEQLDGLVADATLGLLWICGPASDMADEIVSNLRRGLQIERWIGACGSGVFAGGIEIGAEGGIVVLCLSLPHNSFSLERAGLAYPRSKSSTVGSAFWLLGSTEHNQPIRLDFAAPEDIGGLCHVAEDGASLILNAVVAGGAVGLRCTRPLKILAGLSRGTRELGPWRKITSNVGGHILELDGKPAASIVEADSGEILARQPQRLVRQIIVETGNSTENDILMPRLTMIESFERQTGKLIIRDARPGHHLRLVHRPPETARRELREMVRTLLDAASANEIVAAILLSSEMRGCNLFGPDNIETNILYRELRGIPLVGIRTSDEFYRGQLTCGAALLALIVREPT